MGKYLTAEQLAARSRRDVTLADGSVVLIRKLGLSEVAALVRGIPDLAAFMSRDRDDADPRSEATFLSGPSGAAVIEAIDQVVIAGVVDPKLNARAEDGPTPNDLDADDRMTLFTAILGFTGFSREEAEAVRPSSRTSA